MGIKGRSLSTVLVVNCLCSTDNRLVAAKLSVLLMQLIRGLMIIVADIVGCMVVHLCWLYCWVSQLVIPLVNRVGYFIGCIIRGL